MSTVPLIPDNAPFSAEQRAWLNGFLAGIFSRTPASANSAAASLAPALTPLTILFGTQTGTAETLAKQAAKEAGKRGFAATVLDMAAVTTAQLAQHSNLLIITSTYGDGEPPDNAKALHTALAETPAAPTLSGVRFAICALGDTNYVAFCQCGKDFDERLVKHGAIRALDRVDCDLDYDASFASWLTNALTALAPTGNPASANSESGQIINDKSSIINNSASSVVSYSKQNPFAARVLAVRNLNAPGSAKEVNHVEFSLENSGLVYEAGDALGVIPQNCPELVAAVLTALNSDGEEAVTTAAGELPLRTALLQHYDLGKPPAALLNAYGLAGRTDLLDVLDVLHADTTPKKPAHLVGLLKKIQPRLYSISSSPKAHAGQVHLTVGAVRYEHAGRTRKGVCSTYLAERALTHGTVGVFVHSNKAFRPPANGDTPVIMIGPGTGIAPFRAFLHEREASGAKGKNWLFFGDQRASTDFLYQDELAAHQASGHLARLDLAFSRDQTDKIYVQHRMREAATELYAWLEAGAHLYVCGDASRMAKDVDAALHDVLITAGGKSKEDATSYVNALKAAKRYQRDVY